jgi:PAS domain S-box-containing protein
MAYRCRNDADETMEFVSEGCRRLTGFTSHELVENRVVSFRGLIHADDRERVTRAIQRALLRGSSYRVTYRLRRVDGSVRWVWEQGVGVGDRSPGALAVEGLVLDITDRHELAERVAEQESRYRALVEQSLAGVYVISNERFVYVNRRFGEIFGYSADEVSALESVASLVHPDDRPIVERNLKMRLEGAVEAIRYEVRGVRKDGSICDIEVQGKRIEWDGEPAVMGVLLDITERKQAQSQRHNVQKMEALGRLASGVAHDFNNVLGVIKTTAQLAREEQSGDSRLSADLDEIIDAVDRGAALSRQLTNLGRSDSSTPRPTSLAGAVEGLMPLLSKVVGRNVRLETTLEPDMPPLAVDRSHLEEVIMNLVINAVDSMPDGGTVKLTAHMQPHGAEGSPSEHANVPHAVLQVADAGCGIPPDLREHIFEPYFSTKGDEGTGLGLTNVWRVARDAGGIVAVDSEVGVGSTISVYLPLRDV